MNVRMLPIVQYKLICMLHLPDIHFRASGVWRHHSGASPQWALLRLCSRTNQDDIPFVRRTKVRLYWWVAFLFDIGIMRTFIIYLYK